MPRNILKKVLQNVDFIAAVQKMRSKLPVNMQSPLETLQSLSQDLQGDMDEMMEKLGGVMVECKEAFAQRPDIKFPQDLIKSVDPIPILAMIGEKIPPPLDQAYNTALELAAFAPLMPVLDKLKNQDLEGALAVVMSSAAVLKVTARFDPEMPRNILKKVLQNVDFIAAVQKMRSKLPVNMQSPLETLQSLSQDLEGDMDEMMEKLGGVMVECKEAFAQRPDIKFPQDLIKSVDPIPILAMIGEKIPPPLDQAYNTALELAAFAPLMPVLDKLKNQDLEGALAVVMSSAAVLKVTARFDPEMPRNILKKVLQNVDFIAAVQKMRSKLPVNMQSPLETLQSLSQDLEGDMDEMMEKLGGVMVECKEAFAQRPDIKFPQDLIKSVDPIPILAMIGEKIPPPLDQAYNTALELAAFAPLMPVLDKLKNQDLEGALAVVMSSAAVLKVTARLDPEMPRNILKKVLQNVDFIAAVQKMRSKLPVNMQSPLETLQSLSQDLQGDMDEMMEKLGGVMVECKEAFAQRPDIKFPQDLIKSVDPIPILAMIGEKIPPPLDQAYNTALELAAFAPLMPVLDKLKNQDLEGALAVVMSSAAVLKVTARFDPEMPRNILKKVLQNVDFIAAVQKMRSKLPVNMQSPLETLQSLSQDLEGDMDEMMEKLGGVMVECKEAFAQRPDIKFPQDLIKSVDPIPILAMIGEKIPPPLDQAYNTALELAAFAPLMPVLDKLKNQDLEGALAVVMSSAAVLKVTARLDPEMPRNILKKVLQNVDFIAAVQKMRSKLPVNMQSPLETLQSLSQDLEGDMDEMMEKLGGVMVECKEAFAQRPDIKFPQDLIKSVDPIPILAMIGEKIPPPLDQAYNTALELAAFAPLMPVLDKLKNQDLEGALAVVMSSAAVLKVTARFDPEMPRNILKKVLQNVDFIAAVQKMRSKLPVNMQSPLETLQSLSQDLQGDMDEMMEKLGGVMVECKEAFAQRPDIKFPQDLIKSVDPIPILAMIGEKIPPPLDQAYSKALELAGLCPAHGRVVGQAQEQGLGGCPGGGDVVGRCAQGDGQVRSRDAAQHPQEGAPEHRLPVRTAADGLEAARQPAIAPEDAAVLVAEPGGGTG